MTLRPWLLLVQRSRRGQGVQASAGNWTVAPGWNGKLTSFGQRSVPVAQSSVKAVLG